MTVLVEPVPLRDGVAGWFTGRDLDAAPRPVGTPGNLAHRRPHRPADLARDRAEVADVVGVPARRWHLMHQVHGAAVGVVTDQTPEGYELPEVDGIVTTQAGRPLVVQVADCVPVLLAGPTAIGVAHAGRRGVEAGVVDRVISHLAALGDPPTEVVAAIGPAVGGCCYEVPEAVQQQVLDVTPEAAAITTWGSPSLDLRAGVRAQLATAGVRVVADAPACTRCDTRWFSHRRDPGSGRQVGIVVRHEPATVPSRAAP